MYIIYIYIIFGGGNGNLLQYSCLENPMDSGALVLQESDMT